VSDVGTVIVTGGASGLGAAVVRAVEKAGGTPVVFDVNPPQDGADAEIVDLARTREAEQAVKRVVERHGGLDGVVTAAAIDACGQIEDISGEDWDRVVAVNLLGTAAVVRAALPHLERTRGRIVTVGSTLGIKALPDATAYCASKFGVVGFTRALAAETAGRVAVTLLIPGGMDTNFFDGREEKYKPPPELELQDPDDVAEAVLYALQRPRGSELRELVVCGPTETSWP
jgi:NAD(P)-dependent dehydrogenase (short-subunit alcohol dehydrogenase family)